MKNFMIALVLSMSVLFTAPSQALTNTELVGICGPDPENYSTTLPNSEWACEQAADLFERVQAGEPPAPVPGSCTIGTFPTPGTIVQLYPTGTHAWYLSGQGGVLRVERIMSYSVTTTSILAKDTAGLNYTLATGFTNLSTTIQCLTDLIKARRL